MHDLFILRAVASHRIHSPITKKASNTKSALHQLFFMNEVFFLLDERNRELNKHLCATEGTFLLLALPISSERERVKEKAKNVYRTGFINELLALKYRRPIANHKLNWKLKIVFFPKTSFKRNFVMHGISLSFTMFYQLTTECTHKIADISDFLLLFCKVLKHKYILFNLFVEMRNEMQTIN